jgi:hypothetical protein
MTLNRFTKNANTILLGTSFLRTLLDLKTYATAVGARRLIIITFTVSFTTRQETIA